jgi:hypothetical protein
MRIFDRTEDEAATVAANPRGLATGCFKLKKRSKLQ